MPPSILHRGRRSVLLAGLPCQRAARYPSLLRQLPQTRLSDSGPPLGPPTVFPTVLDSWAVQCCLFPGPLSTSSSLGANSDRPSAVHMQDRSVICKSRRSTVCSSNDVATGLRRCSCESPQPSSGRVSPLLVVPLQSLRGWTRHSHNLPDPIGIDNYSRSSQEGRLRLPQGTGGDGPCSICSPTCGDR